MKQIPGSSLFVPDSETHMLQSSKKTGEPVWKNYQADRVEAALQHVSHFDVAVDVGAHVGLLSLQLVKHFKRVYAFEPAAETFECLVKNTAGTNVIPINAAVGDKAGEVAMEDVAGNTGDRQVVPEGRGVKLVPLDEADLPGCDLLKIDVQGFEAAVIGGAMRSLVAFSPVIIMEQEPKGKLRREFAKPDSALKDLEKYSAILRDVRGADHIFSFGEDGARPFTKYARQGAYHWRQYREGKLSRIVDATVAYVNSCEFKSVLDVGCGDGLYTSLMQNAVGIDNNKVAVRLARQHHVAANHHSAYRIEELGRFDAVTMFDVFEHLPFPKLMMEKLARVTNNIVIQNPTPNQSPWHYSEFQHDDLVAFVERHGWRLLHRCGLGENDAGRNPKFLMHFARVG